jgi:hypothetical protein
MPYALFEDDDKLSQTYPTEADVWRHAQEAGLVDLVDGEMRLEDHYTIQPCPNHDMETIGEDIIVPPNAG